MCLNFGKFAKFVNLMNTNDHDVNNKCSFKLSRIVFYDRFDI